MESPCGARIDCRHAYNDKTVSCNEDVARVITLDSASSQSLSESRGLTCDNQTVTDPYRL